MADNTLLDILSKKVELFKALRSRIWNEMEEYIKKVLENDGELGNDSYYESISSLLTLEWKVNKQIAQLKYPLTADPMPLSS